MQQTIIGVFTTERQASDARSSLRNAGFSNVEVQNKDTMSSRATGADGDSDGGGIAGFFRRLFGSEDHPDANQYSQSLDRGRWIVVAHVDTDAEADSVTAVMEDCGAVDVDQDEDTTATSAGSTYGRESAGYGSDSIGRGTDNIGRGTDNIGRGTDNMQSGRTTDTSQSTQRIPVVEEELHVGKRTVERGGARIYTRTTEKPVEETVNLREQRIIVERRPVNRSATAADLSQDQERVLEVRTIAEEPVIAKTARVVEEVEIGRETTEHEETIRDRVRRTDVEVEQVPEETHPGAASPQRPETRPHR
jgi:uncharacterized protein (TIGR02271 family)